MNEKQIIDKIESGRIIAILRGDFREAGPGLVDVLVSAGVTAVEVTLNSPGALALITLLADRFGEATAIGAGTVLTPDEANRAADAGARFIVSPNRNVAVIAATKRRQMVSLPGCFTPSEIIEAFDAGADAAKLFPANSLGPAFVKAVRAPIASARLVPTGGVTPELAREYRAAGAWAVGVGSELVRADLSSPGGPERLASRAAAFVAAMK